MKPPESYRHGNLRAEMLRLGLEAIESEGGEKLSLRALADLAGVSKTAPYRHFPDKDSFLGALADEGFHMLYRALEEALTSEAGDRLGAMGRAYMRFAVGRPALYRLMHSPLICRLPEEATGWARRSLELLTSVLAASAGSDRAGRAAIGAWAYIHGLALIRIDELYPERLGEPDWDELASSIPSWRTE